MKPLLLGLTTACCGCSLILIANARAAEPMPDGKDLKEIAPGPESMCDYSWTGFYVGARIGGGWNDSDFSAHGEPVGQFTVDPEHQDLNADGFIGGGELGFNWQLGQFFVVGAETDFLGSAMSDSTTAFHRSEEH